MLKFGLRSQRAHSSCLHGRREALFGSAAAISLVALMSLASPGKALADDECGVAPPAGGTVTCTTAGNPYPNGITYIVPPADLTVVLEPGVIIDTTGGLNPGVLLLTVGTDPIVLDGRAGASIITDASGGFGVLGATNDGDLTIGIGSVVTSGASATGVFGTSSTGAVAIDAGAIYTSGGGASGVSAYTDTGAITVNTFTVRTDGVGSDGVYASSDGGNVHVTGSTTITNGDGSRGVFAHSDSGSVTVDGDAVLTYGAGSGGVVATSFSGPVVVDLFQVSTEGDNADAIFASSTTGSASASVSFAGTSGDNSRALAVTGGTDATATQSGFFIGTGGNDSTAVYVRAGTGTATANVGNASTNGDRSIGIDAASTTGAVVVSGGAVTTHGVDATGILARGVGSVGVSGSSIRTYGATSNGIDAASMGGPLTITAGQVSTAGAGSIGVLGANSGGTTSLTVNNSVTSALSDAVSLTGTTVTASTATGSTVSGRTAGIRSVSTGATNLTLRGTVSSAAGYAIDATGGPVTVTNSGTVNGRIRLSANADSFTNSGTFNATGASDLGAGADTFTNSGTYNAAANTDFGAGADVFNNAGTLNVLPAASAAGTITFANLETFNNTGLVTLQNGHAGDSLVMPGTFNGSGASRLALDVGLAGTPVADHLVIGSATGSTVVSLNNSGAGLLTSGVVIVDGAAASPAMAFTLNPANVNSGFVNYRIVYDSAGANFVLIGAPQPAAFETLILGEALQNNWRISAGSWSTHMSNLRDAAWSGTEPAAHGRAWMEIYGGSQQRGQQRSFTTFGVTQDVNLGYDQSAGGFQGGYDMTSPMWGGALTLGVTVGAGRSDLSFDGTADTLSMKSYNIGAYAGLVAGPWFVDGLIKADFVDVDIDSPSVGSTGSVDARVYGASGEVGYRFGNDRLFLEPVATMTYVRADPDDYASLQSVIGYDTANSLRGKIGLRVGGRVDTGAGSKLIPYAAAYAVEEFEGEDGVSFRNNGFALPFDNQAPDTFGEAVAGLNWQPTPGLVAFVQGEGQFSGGVDGTTVRTGVRFQW